MTSSAVRFFIRAPLWISAGQCLHNFLERRLPLRSITQTYVSPGDSDNYHPGRSKCHANVNVSSFSSSRHCNFLFLHSEATAARAGRTIRRPESRCPTTALEISRPPVPLMQICARITGWLKMEREPLPRSDRQPAAFAAVVKPSQTMPLSGVQCPLVFALQERAIERWVIICSVARIVLVHEVDVGSG